MKVKITTLMLCVMLSMFITAQQKHDSFFGYQNVERANVNTSVPHQTHEGQSFQGMNVNAPIGNGLIIMLGTSIIYLISKRKEIVR